MKYFSKAFDALRDSYALKVRNDDVVERIKEIFKQSIYVIFASCLLLKYTDLIVFEFCNQGYLYNQQQI